MNSPKPHRWAFSAQVSPNFPSVFTTFFLAPGSLRLPGQPVWPQSHNPSLAFFTFRVCLWVSPRGTGCLQRSCGPPRPAAGVISAQFKNCAVVGSGLVCRDPGPAGPRDSPTLPGAILFMVPVTSEVLKSSPSGLQAWRPRASCRHRSAGASPRSPAASA